MKNKKEIRVCDNCGAPLIWTFCWAYKERYCLNCGSMGGMLGTGEDVELTPKLKAQDKVIRDVWKALQKHLIYRCDYKLDRCKKCQVEGVRTHRDHLSKKEILEDKVATKMLERLNKGFIRRKND